MKRLRILLWPNVGDAVELCSVFLGTYCNHFNFKAGLLFLVALLTSVILFFFCFFFSAFRSKR